MGKERGRVGDDLAWVELEPQEGDLLRDHGFRMFLVQVKSETERGRHLHHDPLDFFRKEITGMEIPDEDVRAMVLRVNAERSANPRHRSELWMVIPGSTTAVGVQYKHSE